MDSNPARAIGVGDRFLDADPRSPGRIVQITDALDGEKFLVRVDEHPSNTSAIGRSYPISAHTLRTRFTRVSR